MFKIRKSEKKIPEWVRDKNGKLRHLKGADVDGVFNPKEAYEIGILYIN